MWKKKNHDTPYYKRKYVTVSTIITSIAALISFLPFSFVLLNMFKGTRDIFASPFTINSETFTLSNVENAFERLKYFQTMKNNIIILVISISLIVVFSSMLAYALASSRSKIASGFLKMIVLMLALPIQLSMIPLVRILTNLNLYNTYWGISFVFVGIGMPFSTYLFYNAMKEVPKELIEAATLDGCGTVRLYLTMYMPLVKSAIGTVVITRSVTVWNDYLITLLCISESTKMTLPLRLNAIVSNYTTDWGMMFAGTVLVTIPIVVLFLSFQKSFMKNIAAGSVKG